MSDLKLANPAVVGLGGFGLTTFLLQIHNLGLIGIGPVIPMAFIFGGLAQFIAGFKEQQMGNNFGFAAFTAFGSFWIGLGIIWLFNFLGIYTCSHHEVGWYLIAWGLYSTILWVASMRVHMAMFATFTTLIIGFLFLALGHFTPENIAPIMIKIAAVDLIICALLAWYMMAAAIINDLAGKVVLPSGKPIIGK